MTLENFHVVNEKLLVKVATDEEVTASGIIMSAANHERKYEGRIVQVGTHPDIEKMGFKPGQYVFYPKGLNTPIEIDNEEYDIVNIYDIDMIGEDE